MVQGNTNQTFDAMENSSIELPEGTAFADVEMARDGQNLVLKTSEGGEIVVENYFLAEPQPVIEASDGSALTPELVEAFTQSPEQLSQIETAAGTEPVGAIEELHGEATVIRTDGSSEPVTLGTPIYEGDVIETSETGGVNILFIDETSMAVSEGARFAVKDYSFDPETESGTTNFSVLRGVFVFTSGLIGRDDPDDVTIDTPVGSIGIRGTIIAGKIDPEGESSITVVEGAIVVKNGGGEQTLDQQFETVQIQGFNAGMKDMGVMEPADVSGAYGSASYVIPSLFSNINDVAKDKAAAQEQAAEEQALGAEAVEEEVIEEAPEDNIQDMMMEDMEKPLEFKQKHEQEPVEGKPHKHNQQNMNNKEAKNFDDELANPDVIIDKTKPQFSINNILKEGAQAGDLAARMQGAPDNVNFYFIHSDDTRHKSSEDGDFQISGNRIIYQGSGITTTSGAQIDLGVDYELIALGPNGEKAFRTFDPYAQDVNIRLNDSGYPSAFENGFVNVGRVNGDNIDDTAYLDASHNVVINSGLSLGVLNTNMTYTYNSLDAIGDVNNDGYDDVIAGTAGNDRVVKIEFNGTSFMSLVPATPGGVSGGYNYGHSVSGAGDFNGDGDLDYIVGAPDTNTNNGRVYLNYTGGYIQIDGNSGERLGHFLDGVGDTNGDGLSDFLIGGDSQQFAYLINGNDSPTSLNTTSLAAAGTTIDVSGSGRMILTGSSAGDFNGDGFDDFVIATTDGTNVTSYVVLGNTSLPTTINMTYLENPSNAYKIIDVNGHDLEYSVRSVGDIDGDGFDNFEIGSDAVGYHIINGNLMGLANYVTDGSVNDGNNVNDYVSATVSGQVLINSRNFHDGSVSNVNVSMNGNSQNNTFRLSNNQFRDIDGGTGFDVVTYGIEAGTLDFSGIHYEQMSGIERIELNGGSANLTGSATVLLTVENIFNLLKTSDNGELWIDEASGFNGTLHVDADVTYADNVAGIVAALGENAGATVSATANATHDIFNVGGYTLYIDQNLAVATV
ncbi:MAG: VCBS repeat-containing protein [Alphaproteobacteria bacterium]|nr:VCBS repeat-containing protein [Alphaproteobacteria bacterium]